jgi:hypothetical protein
MKQFFILLFFVVVTPGCTDFGKLQILASLPGELNEISGIEKTENSPLLWAVSDSKNSADIFGYNVETNSIDRVVTIANGVNTDWEDIAYDGNNTLYVGDFGNNRNNRKDLTIYGVQGFAGGNSKKIKTTATITTFSFEDQKEFPPKRKNRNFDVEAFIVLDGSFYLFTRNRSSKFDGTTKLYRIPAKEGHFEAKLVDSYQTCEDKSDCQITAAAIDRRTGNIALLSYNKVWLLSNYKNDDFFGGKKQVIDLGHSSQKESVTFKDSNSLYIADELTGIAGGNLYVLPL